MDRAVSSEIYFIDCRYDQIMVKSVGSQQEIPCQHLALKYKPSSVFSLEKLLSSFYVPLIISQGK